MNSKNRSRLEIKTEAAIRLISLNTLAKVNDSILITEFPKSGGSWLGNIISDLHSINFPRNRFFNPFAKQIYHGHYTLCIPRNTIVVLRDPRDIVVSLFHHIIIGNSKVHPSLVAKSRKKIKLETYPIDSLDKDLAYSRFIELLWSPDTPIKLNMNHFFDFAFNVCQENKASFTTYELLSSNPLHEITKLSSYLGYNVSIKETSKAIFDNDKNNNKVQQKEGSFLRKGVVGDWKNHLSLSNINLLRDFLSSSSESLKYFSIYY